MIPLHFSFFYIIMNIIRSKRVTHDKKEQILKKLSPFFKQENRLKFWKDIPSLSNSKDLTINIEHLPKQ